MYIVSEPVPEFPPSPSRASARAGQAGGTEKLEGGGEFIRSTDTDKEERGGSKKKKKKKRGAHIADMETNSQAYQVAAAPTQPPSPLSTSAADRRRSTR